MSGFGVKSPSLLIGRDCVDDDEQKVNTRFEGKIKRLRNLRDAEDERRPREEMRVEVVRVQKVQVTKSDCGNRQKQGLKSIMKLIYLNQKSRRDTTPTKEANVYDV